MRAAKNRCTKIIEKIFFKHYREGTEEIPFGREEISVIAQQLRIDLPKNFGDIIYSFRYRVPLPQSIQEKAPKGHEWLILPKGRSKYAFVASALAAIVPSKLLSEIKVLDATPGIITKYALTDEQALLAKLRYNRLIDVFTSVTCYALQSHLRTTVPAIGQVETDEIYIGLDRRGVHYVFPVQAKGGKDKLGMVQINQDFAMCAVKFPLLVCRPIAAQFISDKVIALFEFEKNENRITLSSEKHYRLVPPEEMTPADLEKYQQYPI